MGRDNLFQEGFWEMYGDPPDPDYPGCVRGITGRDFRETGSGMNARDMWPMCGRARWPVAIAIHDAIATYIRMCCCDGKPVRVLLLVIFFHHPAVP